MFANERYARTQQINKSDRVGLPRIVPSGLVVGTSSVSVGLLGTDSIPHSRHVPRPREKLPYSPAHNLCSQVAQ